MAMNNYKFFFCDFDNDFIFDNYELGVQSLFYSKYIKINMAKLLKKEVNSNTSEILMVGIYSVLEGDLERHLNLINKARVTRRYIIFFSKVLGIYVCMFC
jgi:uncharacterized SAM-dependent methyltransferase